MDTFIDEQIELRQQIYDNATNHLNELRSVVEPIRSSIHLLPIKMKNKFNTIVPKVESNVCDLININLKIITALKLLKSVETLIVNKSKTINDLKAVYKLEIDKLNDMNEKIKPIRDIYDRNHDDIKKSILEQKEMRTVIAKTLHEQRNGVRDKIMNFTSCRGNIEGLDKMKKELYDGSKSHHWNGKLKAQHVIDRLPEAEATELVSLLYQFKFIENMLMDTEDIKNNVDIDESCLVNMTLLQQGPNKILSEAEMDQLTLYNAEYPKVSSRVERLEHEITELTTFYEDKLSQRSKIQNQIITMVKKATEYNNICADDVGTTKQFLNSLTEIITEKS